MRWRPRRGGALAMKASQLGGDGEALPRRRRRRRRRVRADAQRCSPCATRSACTPGRRRGSSRPSRGFDADVRVAKAGATARRSAPRSLTEHGRARRSARRHARGDRVRAAGRGGARCARRSWPTRASATGSRPLPRGAPSRRRPLHRSPTAERRAAGCRAMCWPACPPRRASRSGRLITSHGAIGRRLRPSRRAARERERERSTHGDRRRSDRDRARPRDGRRPAPARPRPRSSTPTWRCSTTRRWSSPRMTAIDAGATRRARVARRRRAASPSATGHSTSRCCAERAADVLDVGRRVVEALSGEPDARTRRRGPGS